MQLSKSTCTGHVHKYLDSDTALCTNIIYLKIKDSRCYFNGIEIIIL